MTRPAGAAPATAPSGVADAVDAVGAVDVDQAVGTVGSVAAALRLAAMHGLPRGPRQPGASGEHEVVVQPVDDPVWTAGLVGTAVEQRLTGPLDAAIRAGAIDASAETSAAVAHAHRQALTWCLRLEVELLRLHALLVGAGIEPVVLKGPASAHLDAPDPSLRTFADLDLLIRPEDLDRTVALIEADGGRRLWVQRRPGYDRRFAKSVTMRTHDGIELDLHRSLCDGVHGFRIPIDRLHEQAAELVLGGRSLRCLGQDHRVLHTAYHLALGSEHPRLGSQRDLAQHLVDPSVSLDAVADEARRWRGEAVVATAVRLTLADLPVAADRWRRWADDVPARGPEQRIVDRQRAEGSSIGWGKVAALRELPRWRDRAACAMALAVPSDAHLRSRGAARLDGWRRR